MVSLALLLFAHLLYSQPPRPYFRIERMAQRWAFINAQGQPFLAIGANHTGKFLENPQQSAPLLARFHQDRARAEAALAKSMRDLHLTAGEAYRPLLPSLKQQFPYIEDVTFPNGEKFRFDLFDPSVREQIRRHVASQCAAFAADPNVLGVGFADQPVWGPPRMAYFRNLSAGAPGKQRYVEFLRSRYTGIRTLNAAYRTNFSSFEDALAPFSSAGVQQDDEDFLAMAADSLYALLRDTVRESAPHHLFFGEKFVLRRYPDAVLKAIGRHVDVFLTQALILSPQRPPEWQIFQPEAYRKEHALTGNKPMIIVDWASPFSLDEAYDSNHGRIEAEPQASAAAARWLSDAFREPYIIGVFMCQFIGTHGNDRHFPTGRMKRTYLRDDGAPFSARVRAMRQAHLSIVRGLRRKAP